MAASSSQAATEIRPHGGPQTAFLSSRADIAIYGGAAGGGKSWALLIEPLRHVENGRFGAVIFRRELSRVTREGGLWDEAMDLYPPIGAAPRQSPQLEFRFPSGARVQFGHLEHENSKLGWAGAQIALMGFDQLEEFTEGQFWFMLSRNRTTSGVAPYIRATANPVPPDDPVGGWLARLIQWWWNPETGYPIPERAGVLRWFVRLGNELLWADDREAAVRLAVEHKVDEVTARAMPKSLTFIPAKLSDNPALGGDYQANLLALPLVERERLLGGNWKIKPEAGKIFNRAWFEIVDAAPAEAEWVRAWDKAATPGSGDYSAGILMAKRGGVFYVVDVIRDQWSYGQREKVIAQVASGDTFRCGEQDLEIWIEEEGGSGGKESAEATTMNLAGYAVYAERPTGSKLVRSKPLSAQVEAGNVKLVRGPWNEAFLTELHHFTGEDGDTDDQVDAASLAFRRLALRSGGWKLV